MPRAGRYLSLLSLLLSQEKVNRPKISWLSLCRLNWFSLSQHLAGDPGTRPLAVGD
jgi:hypothetical protein